MARIQKCGPLGFYNLTCKGTNLTHKGTTVFSVTEPLRIRVRASSYHYSLGRPFMYKIPF